MTQQTTTEKVRGKATPGPWTITQESVDPEWHIVTAVGGRIVANVHIEAGNNMDSANARLIVAAPDLIAACKVLLIELENRYDGCPDSPTLWMSEHVVGLTLAIAKAGAA